MSDLGTMIQGAIGEALAEAIMASKKVRNGSSDVESWWKTLSFPFIREFCDSPFLPQEGFDGVDFKSRKIGINGALKMADKASEAIVYKYPLGDWTLPSCEDLVEELQGALNIHPVFRACCRAFVEEGLFMGLLPHAWLTVQCYSCSEIGHDTVFKIYYRKYDPWRSRLLFSFTPAKR